MGVWKRNSRNLSKTIQVPLVIALNNRLSDARVDRPGQNGITADSFVPEPPSNVFGGAELVFFFFFFFV